ncbi:MAG: hypothetical protein WBJ62_09870 [Coriobacteriia bacterium]
MDGTPYPPPTPSVPPPVAPQPHYAPQAPYSPAEPPKKKKTGLIIGIVVAVILLCCCGSGAAGYFLFMAADEEVTESVDEVTNELDSDLPDLGSDIAEDGVHILAARWDQFDPPAYDPSVWVSTDAYHEEVLDDAMSSLFPDFELEERLARPTTEYSTDTVLARATLASDSDVAIAFWLEVENTPAFKSGWVWDPARDGYEYMDVATAANGREYSWDNTQLVPLLFGIGDDSTEDLIRTVANDFPGCVISVMENDGDTATVEFTRWDAYPDYDAGYYADYTYDGDEWELVEAGEW